MRDTRTPESKNLSRPRKEAFTPGEKKKEEGGIQGRWGERGEIGTSRLKLESKKKKRIEIFLLEVWRDEFHEFLLLLLSLLSFTRVGVVVMSPPPFYFEHSPSPPFRFALHFARWRRRRRFLGSSPAVNLRVLVAAYTAACDGPQACATNSRSQSSAVCVSRDHPRGSAWTGQCGVVLKFPTRERPLFPVPFFFPLECFPFFSPH